MRESRIHKTHIRRLFYLPIVLLIISGVSVGCRIPANSTNHSTDLSYPSRSVLKERSDFQNSSIGISSGSSEDRDMSDLNENFAYIMSFFVQIGTWIDQYPIRLAYSYDCLHWTALNDGEKIHPFNTRDPHIFRKKDNTFIIIATGGHGYLNLIESKDLCTFSAPRQIYVGPGGITDTWVGDIIEDPEDGQFIIHYTIKYPDQREHMLYYVKTPDFHAFTEPEILLKKEGIDIIDSCIYNHKGWFYLIFKNDDDDSNHIVRSKKATGPYCYDESALLIDSYLDGYAEGAFIIHSISDDRLFLYYDLFMNNGRWGLKTAPGDSTDLTDPAIWTRMSAGTDYILPKTKQGGPRHGNIIIVTKREFYEILDFWK